MQRLILLLTLGLVITGTGPIQAQRPEMAMTARQAVAEIDALSKVHPESQALHSAAEGAYPLASVNDLSLIHI